jgi:Holliday junction resolvase RusA-like endonuclease
MPNDELKFSYREIEGQRFPTVEFANSVSDPLCLAVFGEIASWAPGNDHEKRKKWQEWHVKISRKVNAKRGDAPWADYNDYAISLGMAFKRPNSRGKLDVDNHIKPIVDAINAFPEKKEMPNLGNRWTFDDSKFTTVLAHKLPDPGNSLSGSGISLREEEGIVICISSM